jgi:hypothetical protein
MKRTLALLMGLAACVLTTAPAAAKAASPLLGTWSLDIASLPVPPERKPKSVTFTFTEEADGKWSTEVNIIGQDGSVRHSKATHPLDGTPTAVIGSDEADTVSTRLTAPNVLVMALSKGGQPGSTRVYTVAPDGKSETETMVTFHDDGTPAMRTVTFIRVK